MSQEDSKKQHTKYLLSPVGQLSHEQAPLLQHGEQDAHQRKTTRQEIVKPTTTRKILLSLCMGVLIVISVVVGLLLLLSNPINWVVLGLIIGITLLITAMTVEDAAVPSTRRAKFLKYSSGLLAIGSIFLAILLLAGLISNPVGWMVLAGIVVVNVVAAVTISDYHQRVQLTHLHHLRKLQAKGRREYHNACEQAMIALERIGLERNVDNFSQQADNLENPLEMAQQLFIAIEHLSKVFIIRADLESVSNEEWGEAYWCGILIEIIDRLQGQPLLEKDQVELFNLVTLVQTVLVESANDSQQDYLLVFNSIRQKLHDKLAGITMAEKQSLITVTQARVTQFSQEMQQKITQIYVKKQALKKTDDDMMGVLETITFQKSQPLNAEQIAAITQDIITTSNKLVCANRDYLHYIKNNTPECFAEEFYQRLETLLTISSKIGIVIVKLNNQLALAQTDRSSSQALQKLRMKCLDSMYQYTHDKQWNYAKTQNGNLDPRLLLARVEVMVAILFDPNAAKPYEESNEKLQEISGQSAVRRNTLESIIERNKQRPLFKPAMAAIEQLRTKKICVTPLQVQHSRAKRKQYELGLPCKAPGKDSIFAKSLSATTSTPLSRQMSQQLLGTDSQQIMGDEVELTNLTSDESLNTTKI